MRLMFTSLPKTFYWRDGVTFKELPALHVPDGRPAWVHYLDYCELRRTFDSLAPDNVGDAVELVSLRAGVKLPNDFDTVQFNLWVLIRRGYCVPKLAPTQLASLTRIMSLTAPTDEDDDTLIAAEGSHRALYTFLTRELGERIPETRGAAYAVASAYLRKLQTTA